MKKEKRRKPNSDSHIIPKNSYQKNVHVEELWWTWCSSKYDSSKYVPRLSKYYIWILNESLTLLTFFLINEIVMFLFPSESLLLFKKKIIYYYFHFSFSKSEWLFPLIDFLLLWAGTLMVCLGIEFLELELNSYSNCEFRSKKLCLSVKFLD